MSLHLIGDDVVFTQRFLKREEFYDGKIDGLWGRLSDRAYREFEGHSETLMRKIGRFDHRTETNIRSLSLAAQKAARQLVFVLADAGYTARIISGTRSFREQNDLFKIGRYGDERKVVTYARGGFSRHNFGIAFDIGLFNVKEGYIRHEQPYKDAGHAAMRQLGDNLDWGGNWKGNFKDWPHYQAKVLLTVAQLRAEFEAMDNVQRAA